MPKTNRATDRITQSADYLDSGRIYQKQRTRDLLVSVAADLLRKGEPFSIADVADTARVSRTTIYSYFPTLEMLLAQATLFMVGSIESDHVDEVARGGGSPEDKVDATIQASEEMVARHEAVFRSVLRLSSEERSTTSDKAPRRAGYRPVWFTNAISDLKAELGEPRFKRLVGALCLCCGIESTVVLRDICLMGAADARETKRWAAQLLLRGALAEASNPRQSPHDKKPSTSKKSVPPQTRARRTKS
jgi:AcrR family transcriptional regulator